MSYTSIQVINKCKTWSSCTWSESLYYSRSRKTTSLIEVLVKLKVLVPPIPNLKVSSALSQNPVSPSPNANCGAAAEPATAPGLTIT
jgi:hypothetical protein